MASSHVCQGDGPEGRGAPGEAGRTGGAAAPGHTHPTGLERIRGVVSIRVAGAGTGNRQAWVNSNDAFSSPCSAKPQLLLLRARSRLVSTK